MAKVVQREESLKKINDIYALLSNLSVSHPDTCQDFENFKQEFQNKICEDFIQSYKECQDKVIAVLEKKIDDFQNYHLSIAESFTEMREAFWIMQSEVDARKRNYETLLETTFAMRDKILSTANEIYACLHENDKKIYKEFSDKIDELPIPQDTVSLPQAEDLVEKKIEPTRLDARNALLTAKNHELRLSILEKKIENALLQLKNMELTNP